MFEIREIPIGTIPDQHSKIYPEYLEGEYIKVYRMFGNSDGANYLLGLKTLFPVERGGIKYLVPFSKNFEEQSITRNIEDHSESKVKFKLWSNEECDRLINKFIIPDPKDYKDSSDGCVIVIYKYKENV